MVFSISLANSYWGLGLEALLEDNRNRREMNTCWIHEELIVEWIRVELYTKQVYGRLASKTSNEYARTLFVRLSVNGQRHAEILRKILTLTSDSRECTDPTEINLYPKQKESFQVRYSTEVQETYWTMKEHLRLEEAMREAYQSMAKRIKKPQAISLLHALVKEEELHHRELSRFISTFEETYGKIIKPEQSRRIKPIRPFNS